MTLWALLWEWVRSKVSGEHFYTSTYCQHGLHGDCRLYCKTCKAPCRCICHRSARVKP